LSLLNLPSKANVCDLGPRNVEQDVGALHVQMQDVVGVEEGETPHNVQSNAVTSASDISIQFAGERGTIPCISVADRRISYGTVCSLISPHLEVPDLQHGVQSHQHVTSEGY
jgi:hypothetical protein